MPCEVSRYKFVKLYRARVTKWCIYASALIVKYHTVTTTSRIVLNQTPYYRPFGYCTSSYSFGIYEQTHDQFHCHEKNMSPFPYITLCPVPPLDEGINKFDVCIWLQLVMLKLSCVFCSFNSRIHNESSQEKKEKLFLKHTVTQKRGLLPFANQWQLFCMVFVQFFFIKYTKAPLIGVFHVTSYEANFASYRTRDRHVGFHSQ